VAASQHKNRASTRVAAASAGVSLPKGPVKGIILRLVKLSSSF
jgi:hypothetical protein